VKDYKQTIEELFSRHQSVQTSGFTSSSYKPGLESMKQIDHLLGSPSKKFRSVHVAGTNGKGSVSHMLAAALAASGYKTGLFTSPHLVDFRERMKIVSPEGCQMISESEVMDFISRYSRDIDMLSLSFFELTTAMAFWWFASREVDVAVIEVGLGGLLDSTNIIIPELSVVTSIGLDHCALLGNTRAQIALQKAGIFKKDVTALVGARDEETEGVFRNSAKTAKAELHFADDELPLPEEADILVAMDLRGEYQRLNLHTALVALQLLQKSFSINKVAVPQALIHTAGLTGLHGRWEKIADFPAVICDIGHNPPALRWNFKQLDEALGSGEYSALTLVYGIMADKDLEGIMPLMPLKADYIFVTPATQRALPAEKILERFLEFRRGQGTLGQCSACVGGSVEEGLSLALSRTAPTALIYVGGSAFVVADLLKKQSK